VGNHLWLGHMIFHSKRLQLDKSIDNIHIDNHQIIPMSDIDHRGSDKGILFHKTKILVDK